MNIQKTKTVVAAIHSTLESDDAIVAAAQVLESVSAEPSAEDLVTGLFESLVANVQEVSGSDEDKATEFVMQALEQLATEGKIPALPEDATEDQQYEWLDAAEEMDLVKVLRDNAKPPQG